MTIFTILDRGVGNPTTPPIMRYTKTSPVIGLRRFHCIMFILIKFGNNPNLLENLLKILFWKSQKLTCAGLLAVFRGKFTLKFSFGEWKSGRLIEVAVLGWPSYGNFSLKIPYSLVAIGFCPKKNIVKMNFLYLFCIGVVSTL